MREFAACGLGCMCACVCSMCVYKMLSSASTDCPILDVSFFDHLANHSLWTDITEVSTRPMSVGSAFSVPFCIAAWPVTSLI